MVFYLDLPGSWDSVTSGCNVKVHCIALGGGRDEHVLAGVGSTDDWGRISTFKNNSDSLFIKVCSFILRKGF